MVEKKKNTAIHFDVRISVGIAFDGIEYSRKRNTVLSTMKNCVQTRALGTFGGQLSHYFWRRGVGGGGHH